MKIKKIIYLICMALGQNSVALAKEPETASNWIALCLSKKDVGFEFVKNSWEIRKTDNDELRKLGVKVEDTKYLVKKSDYPDKWSLDQQRIHQVCTVPLKNGSYASGEWYGGNFFTFPACLQKSWFGIDCYKSYFRCHEIHNRNPASGSWEVYYTCDRVGSALKINPNSYFLESSTLVRDYSHPTKWYPARLTVGKCSKISG